MKWLNWINSISSNKRFGNKYNLLWLFTFHFGFNITLGKNIKIGLIDSPANLNHPDFKNSHINIINKSKIIICKETDSITCFHGTAILGILASDRSSIAPSICPDCEILLNPIFMESTNESFPIVSPLKLANSIIETVDAGANIINLSLSLNNSNLSNYSEINTAYNYALKNNVIITIASGDFKYIGNGSLITHPWLIPVVACDQKGMVYSQSNLGYSIAKNGIMAPGINIKTTASNGGYITVTGSSFATAIVTGTLALLWSLYPKLESKYIINSIRSGFNSSTIVPLLLNVEKSLNYLKSIL